MTRSVHGLNTVMMTLLKDLIKEDLTLFEDFEGNLATESIEQCEDKKLTILVIMD